MKREIGKLLLMVALAGNMGATAALEASALSASPAVFSPGDQTVTNPNSGNGLRSVLEAGNGTITSDYRFSITPPPEPTGWVLLLGALLTGGFIARRRLKED